MSKSKMVVTISVLTALFPLPAAPVRSRSLENIREEVSLLGAEGYGEVVLTGIHIGSYGKDLDHGISLIDVIEEVHRAEGISRIRLGSLEPVLITEDFVRRASALPKLCPQFHLSLQSGCDATLARMHRHYTTADYRRAVHLLREAIPHTAITTDLMVGFPGETEEEFNDSYAFCREIGFAQMHIFPYSVRQGTAAENFPQQIPEEIKAERTHAMLELAKKSKEDFYRRYLGKTVSILAEQKTDSLWHGTTANYMDVLFPSDHIQQGDIVSVIVSDYRDEHLIGKILNTHSVT